MGEAKRERLEYGELSVPIFRESIQEVYVALQPPDAAPYIVAPHAMDDQRIIAFFSARFDTVERLRAKMRKRFEGGGSTRCRYTTGDIAYIMGRPFMLQVNATQGSKSLQKGTRGRVTAKCTADTEVSLITLEVAKLGDYDQARSAFLSYASAIVAKNAERMAAVCCQRIMPGAAAPPVRIREMRGRFTSFEQGSLWLSSDIVPYPVDCLAYAVWNELMAHAAIPAADARRQFQAVLPGWERAGEILAERAKPYSNQ